MAGNEKESSGADALGESYDVVLSFSPGDRKSVEILALELARRNIRVYRDETPEALAWGARLGMSIPHSAGVRSRYVILHISHEAARGLWREEGGGVSDGSVVSSSISYLCCPPESVGSIADRVSQELRKAASESVPRIWRVPLGGGPGAGMGVPVVDEKPAPD